ncbi:MAG: periplasmic heavy metal sensor [Limisphaerales bacterium]
MTRSRWKVLLAGLLIGIAAYASFYLAATANHRRMACQPEPELAWLKAEFKLSDAEFTRVSELHNGYLPRCEEMCKRVATKNAELKTILAKSDAVNPDIQKKVHEIADLKAQCQAQMLQHFYDVSRAMPPEQGKRYLQWVQSRTVLCGQGDDMMAHMQ